MKLLTRTKLSDLTPLYINGQSIHQLSKQLGSLLLREEIGKGELEFAEPKVNKARNEIQWFCNTRGKPVSFGQLESEFAAQVRGRLQKIIGAIEDVQRGLISKDIPREKTESKLLSGCLTGISTDHLYVIDNIIILCGWGCQTANAQDMAHVISLKGVGLELPSDEIELKFERTIPEEKHDLAADQLPGSPIREGVKNRDNQEDRNPFLWSRLWPLFLFLFVLLLFLFMRGCSQIGIPAFQYGIPTVIPEATLDDEAKLREEIEGLRQQLITQVQACTVDNPPIGDTEDQTRLEREGRSIGEVNINLIWSNLHDLDLLVEEPTGARIDYKKKSSPSGGYLDIDQNAGNNATAAPIENIKWDYIETAPKGIYKVYVVYFKAKEADSHIDPTDFRVTTTIDGVRKEFTGQISRNQLQQQVYVTEFELK